VKITFLGTGTSQGVPVIGCKCAVCQSVDPKDNRLRCSIIIQKNNTTIVIDPGPDFRQQLLRNPIEKLDAIVITHSHKDHIAGLDDVRAFNFLQGTEIPVYATTETQAALRKEFSYIFAENKYPGIPQISLQTISHQASFTIGDITLQPIALLHHQMNVLGFRCGNFTYITDANYIAPIEIEKFADSEYLVLNALRWEKHISHFNVEEATALAKQTSAKQVFLTHISHQLGLHNDVLPKLAQGITLAYDGLILNL
jgi:phosphoribosyl 1,2-cyclic phosphate phosphodiesterase